MKRFLRSKLVLTLAALVMIAAAVGIPLVHSTSRAYAASSIDLKFNSLPSAQGFTYFQSDGIPEANVFSVTGTSLIQNTIGIGQHNPNYALFGVVNGSEPFVLTVRVRILAYETFGVGGPLGFFFDVRTATPNQEYAIGFTPSLVTDPLGNGVAIDTTVFHTYVLKATPGGNYTLDIDGQFAFGGPFSSTGGALNAIQLGDGNTQGANASAEITQFTFSQGLDTTPPSITITSPTATTYLLNQPVLASYSCTDSDSAVATCAGSVASGAPIDTASVGTKTFTVQASDPSGNTSSKSVTYTVGYNICPLYDQTKAVNSGATIPIKLELCDANGSDVSASSIVVTAVSVTQVSTNAPGQLEAAGNANPDNNFRFDATLGTAGGYIFNLSTKGLATGTYALSFTAGSDPTLHTVQFEVN